MKLFDSELCKAVNLNIQEQRLRQEWEFDKTGKCFLSAKKATKLISRTISLKEKDFHKRGLTVLLLLREAMFSP